MQFVWFMMAGYPFISSQPLTTLLEQHLSESLCATARSRLEASQGAEIFIPSQYTLMIVPFDHSGSSASRDIFQIQIARIRTTDSTLLSALAKESTEDGGDEG